MNSMNKIHRPILFGNQLTSIKYNYLEKCHKSYSAAVLKYVTASTVLAIRQAIAKLKQEIRGNKKPKVPEELPKDTVILYQFPRAINSPTLSPSVLKLETWLKAANIKYQNKFGTKKSSQGLIPFIQLNGYFVPDSQGCIEYLSKVYRTDMNSGLTEEQKAISRSVLKLVDDSLRWCMVLHRFWLSNNPQKELSLPLIIVWYFSLKAYTAAYYAGYGRFSKEEIYENGKRDLTTLNTLIGKKKYLFSDTKPCDTDFAIFGVCAQIKYNDLGPLNIHLNTECHNVVRHIENMKQTYWPDWNQNLLPVKPKKSLLSRLIKRK